MVLSEPENAKSRIAYRYPYGTDNFVLNGKFSGVTKISPSSFLRAAEKII